MYFLPNMEIFHCYVSLPEGTWHFTNSIFGHSFWSWTIHLSSWPGQNGIGQVRWSGSLSFYEPWWGWSKTSVWSMTKPGQIIATSHDLTPNGGLVREIPLFQGNLGWWNILIWPDETMVVSNMFYFFTPKLGEDEPILTSIFFKWVGSTTN